jgi:hypothetical protein
MCYWLQKRAKALEFFVCLLNGGRGRKEGEVELTASSTSNDPNQYQTQNWLFYLFLVEEMVCGLSRLRSAIHEPKRKYRQLT